jgi:hypothetical protein
MDFGDIEFGTEPRFVERIEKLKPLDLSVPVSRLVEPIAGISKANPNDRATTVMRIGQADRNSHDRVERVTGPLLAMEGCRVVYEIRNKAFPGSQLRGPYTGQSTSFLNELEEQARPTAFRAIRACFIRTKYPTGGGHGLARACQLPYERVAKGFPNKDGVERKRT